MLVILYILFIGCQNQEISFYEYYKNKETINQIIFSQKDENKLPLSQQISLLQKGIHYNKSLYVLLSIYLAKVGHNEQSLDALKKYLYYGGDKSFIKKEKYPIDIQKKI